MGIGDYGETRENNHDNGRAPDKIGVEEKIKKVQELYAITGVGADTETISRATNKSFCKNSARNRRTPRFETAF